MADTDVTEKKPQSVSSTYSGNTAGQPEEPVRQSIERNGAWHLDEEKNACYTDDLVDMKDTIRYDADHAVFEVKRSTSGLAEVGTTWVFPELQKGF